MNAQQLELPVTDDADYRYILSNWSNAYMDDLVRHANDADVAKYLANRFPHPYTSDDAMSFLAYASSTTTERLFAIVRQHKVTGAREAIGGIGMNVKSDVQAHSGEVGYWLGKSFWGCGLMTHVVATFLDGFVEPYRGTHAPVPLSRLFAVVYAPNTGSVRVLEKNGFEVEGRLRRHE
ncbi:hypothetical protein SPRG_03065 [Saprolegnia parasitica CBS 223.65]|uniref:N-acetyltransferase domain-containing protein n=1 Tax=Saprolegnia parasitica (strain CBS 223.65) TaxID=695850 RepID=A0A067D1F4_SAPPC|nr:hypothetical protein SPRG_03065 [Saprolegnia parasitica CBS 223.65]KDO32591.1 hypothetical protein SPRG_03065 [Saprolegnia parasitica CBS 223.65]|eukprot:XP_012197036.1 hypothetical protein SPRG_03065 [Saprolegnia parasitica CBS 223.65]